MSFAYLQTQFEIFILPKLQFNWVDGVIIVVLFLYALEGFSVGFVIASVDLLSFLLSFAFGLRFYSIIGHLLEQYVSIPHGFANAIGFFIVAILSEILVSILFRQMLKKILRKIAERRSDTNFSIPRAYMRTLDRAFGSLPGLASGMILLSFLLTMIVALPFSPTLKNAVSESKLGGPLVSYAAGFEKDLHTVFGGAVQDTLSFLTIEPHSSDTVPLNFKTTTVSLDPASEKQMVVLINQQREKKGLKPLAVNTDLRELAREYAKDMLAKGYFSHYSPQGTSPFDRMSNFGIPYTSAGENLALAPDVSLAMQGLMNSPGHRANILSQNYAKIGVGVIDAGIYGRMFVQEFTN